MAKPAKITALFIVLSLLATAAVGLWLFLLLERQPALDNHPASVTPVTAAAPVALAYVPTPIGARVERHPIITHVAIADLDGDGLQDVVVCDAEANQVNWIRQSPRGTFTEHQLGETIPAPVRVVVCDLNQDGKLDLLVASAGRVLPNDDRIGRVVVLENLGENQFRNRVLAEDVGRVTDVHGADLNGDARLDVVVCQFGSNHGEIGWLENLGDWQFRDHVLASQPGAVSACVADYDRDGKADIAVMFASERAEVRRYHNLGAGAFREDVLWKAGPRAMGGSGMAVCDLNRDGRPDLLCATGARYHAGFSEPSAADGLHWLENRGDTFEPRRIGPMPGGANPDTADLDGDGDLDVLAVAPFNHVIDAGAVWMAAWINDGSQNFTAVPLAHDPSRLFTVAAGDLDGNGVPVLVTGAFHVYPPFTRLSRVTLWRRK